jgi:hypothetical protein
MLGTTFPYRPLQPSGTALEHIVIPLLSLAVLVAALLVNASFRYYRESINKTASAEHREQSKSALVASLLFCAVLLATALYDLYWFTVWDNSSDSLGLLWLLIPSAFVLISCISLEIALPGRSKTVGAAYLLIIAVMFVVSLGAQQIDYRKLTELRASQISQAIEDYRGQEGRYPGSLQQLFPWFYIALPSPVIIYGQNWCYDGGEKYYRLGYVSRPHWSAPIVTGETYRSVGEIPSLPAMCSSEIAALQANFPFLAERR